MRSNRTRKWLKALVILIALLAGIVLVGILAAYDYLAPVARVNTAMFATSQTAALARVDFGKLGALAEVFETLPWTQRMLCDLLIPHESTVVLDVDEALKMRRVIGAVSARRLGALILSQFGRAAEVPALGAIHWTTPGIVSEQGAWVLRGEEPIAQEVLDTMRERWPAATADAPMTLEGGHLLEAYVDNRRGQGFLALAELSLESIGVGKTHEKCTDGARPSPQELQRIFDARELSGLLYRARVGRLTADSQGADGVRIQVRIECIDQTAARSVEFAFMTIRDLAFRQLLELGIILEGDTSSDGTHVVADVTLSGIKKACRALGNPAKESRVEKQSHSEGDVR